MVEHYERVTFKIEQKRVPGKPDATLLAPGHPLLEAVIQLTIEDLGKSLERGTIFIDNSENQRSNVSRLYAIEQRIVNSSNPPMTVDRHFDFIEVSADSSASVANLAPYLDFDSPSLDQIPQLEKVIASVELADEDLSVARRRSVELGITPILQGRRETAALIRDKTRLQILERLNKEINHWDTEHNRLLYQEDRGKPSSISAKTAFERARNLEARRDSRLLEIEREATLIALAPIVRTAAIVVPSKLLLQTHEQGTFAASVEDRKIIERRAVDLVMKCERQLGRDPFEMPPNNRGFDLRSITPNGEIVYLEVKGRIAGADTFTITASEVSFAQTQGFSHRLALVSVSPEGLELDEVRYLSTAFDHLQLSERTASINERWQDYWLIGDEPH